MYTLIGKTLYNAFNSSKILSLLIIRPVVGNLFILLLTAVSGLSVAEYIIGDDISASELCETVSVDVRKKLGVDSSEITDVSAETTLSSNSKQMLSCTYDITSEAGNTTSRENFDVTYHVSGTGLTSNIEQVKITKEDLENICDDEDVYGKVIDFEVQNSYLFSLGEDAGKFYPAFRWRCGYTPISPSINPSDRPDEQADARGRDLGLDLDAFCEREHINRGFTKAAYHYYDDDDSWYCTNPNITGNSRF